MSLPSLVVGLGDRAPYAVAFLSSNAIEVIAVAALLTVIANTVTRRAARNSGAAGRAPRSLFRIEPMHFHKLIIPVLSLGLTIWLWTATRGA